MTEPHAATTASSASTAITRFNALRHGVLSRYTVLPWEDWEEYQVLLTALVAEHAPRGPTEEHLVEELAGILWRKRRLRLAEAAAVRRGLQGTFASYHETAKMALAHLDDANEPECVSAAVRATADDTDEDMADMTADETMTRRALELLASKRNDAYEAALAGLREDTQAWWADVLARDPDELGEDEQPATADVEGLRRFLEDEVLPWFENRRRELANRPLIREQAFGEALDPDKLERLGRYEVHLDRKLERMLTMLIRLQGLRATPTPSIIPFGKNGPRWFAFAYSPLKPCSRVLPGVAPIIRAALRYHIRASSLSKCCLNRTLSMLSDRLPVRRQPYRRNITAPALRPRGFFFKQS
jgi:hypothetical protein